MAKKHKGQLLIVGGHEEKAGERTILKEIAKHASRGLVIVAVASQEPDTLIENYTDQFSQLGVKKIEALDIRMREAASDEASVNKLGEASVIFFTGGDQLRITSQIGDSPVFRRMCDLHAHGCMIAGTSAGAAAMSETMLIGGPGGNSHAMFDLEMAPGLGLIDNVVIDSHFAQRGRIGRLLAAVAQNPRILGLGIDEDTAILVEPDQTFTVLGSGAVYVLDGYQVPFSNLSEDHASGVLTAFDIKLHVLGADHEFDLKARRPMLDKKVVAEIPDKEAHQD